MIICSLVIVGSSPSAERFAANILVAATPA
jgi:hypothetical protein